MPSLDLESLLSLAVAGKVTCESTLPAMADLPAEAVLLPLDQHLDWMDRNGTAPIYEREDSTKGPSNPKSHHPINAPIANAITSNGNSQRFSANLNPIGLPRKPASVIGLIGSSQRFTGRLHIFPNRKVVAESDPASPKVSCCGKVLSNRERPHPPRRGLLRRLVCCGGRPREAAAGAAEEAGRPEGPRRWEERAAPAPGIGAARRFASGRSWASLDADEMERSGPLDVADICRE